MAMKTLWVSHVVPYPPKAGVLLRCYNLVRELSRYTELDLVAFIQEPWLRTCFGDVDKGLAEARRALGEFCRVRAFLPIPSEHQTGGRLRLVLSSLVSGPCSTVQWLASPEAARILRELRASERYDVVHFDTISLAQYRPIFDGVSASLGHHNIESAMLLRRAAFEPSPLKRRFFLQEGRRLADYERETSGWFDTHITCSALDSERLREICGHPNIVEIPNGVDPDYFRPGSTDRIANTFVFVGTMDWYPNVDAMRFFLDSVWPALKARYPEATVGIVGSNPPEWLVKVGAADPSIRVYGFVDDVRPYIEGAALYVCPIRDGGGTRLKILDAMAMARCIVAHPVASEGIRVTDGETIVYADEPESFVAQIVALLEDPRRAGRIGDAARQLVQQEYSFHGIGIRLAEHLRGLARPAA
jgi:glycosyltransferase involved in cell wall biosynthesis